MEKKSKNVCLQFEQTNMFDIFRRLATTHFEPTYARRAFPCFDEPQLKAEFMVTITHHKDHSVFFNMPLKTQTMVKGYVNMVSVLTYNKIN